MVFALTALIILTLSLLVGANLYLIIKLKQTIMATLADALAKIEALGAKQDATLAGVAKIGTETEGLKTEIQSLKDIIANAVEVPQAIVDAVDAVAAKADAVSAAVAEVDAKVPDTETTPEV